MNPGESSHRGRRALRGLTVMILFAQALAFHTPALSEAQPRDASPAASERPLEGGRWSPPEVDSTLARAYPAHNSESPESPGVPAMASLDPAMDEPPTDAVAQDANNPNWATLYGTRLGRERLAAHSAPGPNYVGAADGGQPPITDTWAIHSFAGNTRTVTAMAAAPDGRVFVGVQGDGLRVYAPGPGGAFAWTEIRRSSGGLVGNNITALVAHGSYLWIGTENAGISLYHLENGTWMTLTTSPGKLPSNAIYSLTPVTPDPDEGVLQMFIGTKNGAARVLGDVSNFWTVFSTTNGLPSQHVFDIAHDLANNLTYFSTADGIVRYNGVTMTPLPVAAACDFQVAGRVVTDQLGRLWVLARNYYVPLQGDGAQSDPSPGDPSPGDLSPGDLSPSDLSPMAVPPNSNGIGVCRYTPNGNTWVKYDTNSPGLPSNNASDLSVDAAGRVWMSFDAADGGGAVFDAGTWRFFTASNSPLHTGRVSRVLAVEESVWWGHGGASVASTFSRQWRRWFLANDTLPRAFYLDATRTWTTRGPNLSWIENGNNWTTQVLPGNAANVTAITRDGAGDLWAATAGNGVFQLANGTYAVKKHHTAAGAGLPSDDARALAMDHLGRVWVGTAAGIAMWSGEYWIVFKVANYPKLLSNNITALARDTLNRLWIGTAAHGIGVFKIAQEGPDAWFTQTVSDGLPSNAIRALAPNLNGGIWAATAAGVAGKLNALSPWAKHTAAGGALDSDDVLSIAVDPAGRPWAGTANGLAYLSAGEWRRLHAPGTMMVNAPVSAIAADATRAWIVAGVRLGARAVLTRPIGGVQPVITSFAPAAAAPGATITVTGTGFDARGSDFNAVRFNGQLLPTGQVDAEVLSATATQLVVRVPSAARTGKLRVEANGLISALSPADYRLKPDVLSQSVSCSGVGGEVTLFGVGFLDSGGGTMIKVGAGPERAPDSASPTEIRFIVRPNDADGQVRVRLPNNEQDLTPSSLDVSQLAATPIVTVQQGIQGEALVWGKSTLVQAQLDPLGGCGVTIDSAAVYWRGAGNATYLADARFYSGTMYIQPNPLLQIVSVNTVPSLVARLSSWSQPTFESFNGMRLVIARNGVTMLDYNIPKSLFRFVDARQSAFPFFKLQRLKGDDPEDIDTDFAANAAISVRGIARILPKQELSPALGEWRWMEWVKTEGVTPFPVRISKDTGNMVEPYIDWKGIRKQVQKFVDPNDNQKVGAMLDVSNHVQITSNGSIRQEGTLGLSQLPGTTVIALNRASDGGKTLAHEMMHSSGYVDEDAANYWPASGSADNHSRYDESQWESGDKDFTDCDVQRTFRQALTDQAGSGALRVVRLDGDTATDLRTDACATGLDAAQNGVAKSVISYSPNRTNANTFLEPVDYRSYLRSICVTRKWTIQTGWQTVIRCPGYATLLNDSYAARNSTVVRTPGALSPADTATRTLRLHGEIGALGSAHLVTPALSYIEAGGGELSLQDPEGGFVLRVLNAGNQVLHEHYFGITGAEPEPHDGLGSAPRHAGHGDAPPGDFALRVAFPVGAKKVEIRHGATTIWSKTMSNNAPAANLFAPVSGEYDPLNVMRIIWDASDVDGDALQYGLEYSHDDGATWQMIDPYVLETNHLWTPEFATATDGERTGRVRVRASDGFHTAYATSTQIIMGSRPPLAAIVQPVAGSSHSEQRIIALEGESFTSHGQNSGSFTWRRDGVVIGAGRRISAAVGGVGVHTFMLTVVDAGLTGTHAVTVSVYADYDRDGIGNAEEAARGMNPLDPVEPFYDEDGDGLPSLFEITNLTNPKSADSDSDGVRDDVELRFGADPLAAASKPPSQPVLNVGANTMGFHVPASGLLPDGQTTWVTNKGMGALTFTVSTSAPWLIVAPTTGAAPRSLFVDYDPTGLGLGTYTGVVTVHALAALNSPQRFTVTLQLDAIPAVPHRYRVHLPLMRR